MDGMQGYTNGVQQKFNEAFAQQDLTAIITSLLYAFISWFLMCREEEEKTDFFFFCFKLMFWLNN